MKRSGWRRPSPALVIACLALFVALGGTVLAATKIDGRTIRVKSLPGNRLRPASVPGNRLRPGTIPGNRIAPRSLRGEQIDATTLAQVPSADHADSADTARHAETATAADHAADATTVNGHPVGCTSGRREWAGACWDVRPSGTAVTAFEAVDTCAMEGGELPDVIPLIGFAHEPGAQLSLGGEWTNELSILTPGTFSVFLVKQGGEIDLQAPGRSRQFRCVTPFLN